MTSLTPSFIAPTIQSQKGSIERRSIREEIIRRPAALFPILLALGIVILAPRSGARAQDAQEGPREIEKCRTIDRPGSYKLVNDLNFTGTTGTCLTITASSVTIDLAGFTISGPGIPPGLGATGTTAIAAGTETTGIVVRNGSISGFFIGVVLGDGSIVEGLRVIGVGCRCLLGIGAKGIVRGNTVIGIAGTPGEGIGISATDRNRQLCYRLPGCRVPDRKGQHGDRQYRRRRFWFQ